ncbi:MAG TPA: aspartate kinase, partial [Firmicutes bacterium]|nr:aspartate kinase [Bacillota bacterium]
MIKEGSPINILVQKYGGTSLATPQLREKVVAKIKEAIGLGYALVVVVSAMGRQGAPYATDTLISLAKEVSPEPYPRDLDLLMACGELISAVIMAQTLRLHGVEAQAFTGGLAGIITNHHFGDARIIEIKPEKIVDCLKSKKVAVVAGFQGITKEDEITTLGRGGSDTTAAALGVALQAETVEIYT